MAWMSSSKAVLKHGRPLGRIRHHSVALLRRRRSVAPTAVAVHEFGVLGSVVAIHALGPAGAWETMYRRDRGAPTTGLDSQAGVFSPPQCGVPRLTREFLLEFDECAGKGWTGVDAVRVFGIAAPPAAVAPAAGRWRFEPAANFFGNVTLAYVATDCWLDPVRATAPTSLTIVVAPVPDPPTAVLPSGDAAVVAEVDFAGIGCGHGSVSWMK